MIPGEHPPPQELPIAIIRCLRIHGGSLLFHLCSGFLLVKLDFFAGVGRFWENIQIYIEIEAQEQYSLIDTIFDFLFVLGSPRKYL